MFQATRIFIYSENPDQLMKYYADGLGLAYDGKIDAPKDYGHQFKLNENTFIVIGAHSEVHGSLTESFRHLFELEVDSVSEWLEKVRSYPGVVVVSEVRKAECSSEADPRFVATILDPEGNCLQFRGFK